MGSLTPANLAEPDSQLVDSQLADSQLADQCQPLPQIQQINQLILAHPWRFTFAKAVELLEQSSTHHAPIGGLGDPRQQRVRFRSVPSLAFAVSEIDDCQQTANHGLEMQVNLMGLYGPTSPLPAYFTEQVMAEVNQGHDIGFYLSSAADIRAFTQQRHDIKQLVAQADGVKALIDQEQLTVHQLNVAETQDLQRTGDLTQFLDEQALQAFQSQTLVIGVRLAQPTPLRDLLDTFNHRLISLLYRATQKYRPYRHYRFNDEDPFVQRLYQLIGAPSLQVRQRSALNWPSLLNFMSLLMIKPITVEAITKIVSGYLGYYDQQDQFSAPTVSVEQGIVRWAKIPIDQLARLGQQNMRLGEDFHLGTECCDQQSEFKLILSSLTINSYIQLLPVTFDRFAGQGKYDAFLYTALRELLNFIKPVEQRCQLILEVDTRHRPKFILGNSEPRMGYTMWLGGTVSPTHSLSLPLYHES